MKYGPSKGELQFRIVVSILGLGFIAAVVAVRGMPTGIALVEGVGLGAAFFLGTLIWSVRGLIKRR